ncbi:MAG: hypothetical protein ABI333_21805 [bacterium]
MTGKPDSLFDKRIISRNIHRGRVTRKEYEQFLKGLADTTNKAVPMFSDEERSGNKDEG